MEQPKPVQMGQSPMEIGRWVYTGISWDFGPGEAQPRGRLEKPQEGSVGRESRGCPGDSGAGVLQLLVVMFRRENI